MKILELALLAFGPFTDVVLDLSGGREGLHLIFGPNEAGKSSALRGLRQALFGIPAQSADDFVHSYTKMRIGLTLRGGDGRTLRFLRRKGNRNTTLAADGTTSLSDEAIQPFLQGLTESEFKSRFALDHDELVQGGKAILQGGGELGALLFQAGGGLKNLQEMQRQLDREIEALFKPGGSKPRINAGLAELRKANEAKRQASLHSAEWVEHETARLAAAAEIVEVEGRLATAHAEKRRLERLKEALPLLTRQRRCEEELASLGPVVPLAESFPKTRLEALSRRETSRLTKERADAAIVDLDRRIAELVIADDLLAEGDAIEHLREGLAADRKARKSLPAEEAKLFQVLNAASDLLAESWPDLAPSREEEYEGRVPGARRREPRARRAPPGRDRGRRAAAALAGPEDRDPEPGDRSDQARRPSMSRSSRSSPSWPSSFRPSRPRWRRCLRPGRRPRSNWRWHRRGTRETWTGRWNPLAPGWRRRRSRRPGRCRNCPSGMGHSRPWRRPGHRPPRRSIGSKPSSRRSRTSGIRSARTGKARWVKRSRRRGRSSSCGSLPGSSRPRTT